jgi:GAF domain-containing protein
VFAAKSFILVREQARVEQEQERETFLHAYTLCDRTITDALRALHAVNISPGELIEKFTTSLDHIQRAVDAAYNTFEAAYGKHVRTEDRIDFEVTFMTKSYLDGHITIPACANRDGRSPRSMVLRRQKPTIYDTTETAAIYRADRPTVRVVENTKAVKTYAELYPGETDRIRSSVIYPVLSESNELLGTLVVHCDKPGFFTAAKEKYWCDLMEVFAKRIALHKRKLDILCQVQPPQPLSIQLPLSKPF